MNFPGKLYAVIRPGSKIEPPTVITYEEAERAARVIGHGYAVATYKLESVGTAIVPTPSVDTSAAGKPTA